ncbi:hypothetical protein HDV01_003877, partial [Terramyces sp. JEL0728]
MDQLFNKPLNLSKLTEEEWVQVKQLKDKKKPSVPFSKATLNHCIRNDGLNLNVDYVNVKAPTLNIPVDFVAAAASPWLCETLEKVEKVWVLDNEKSCRIVIDAILTEVLLTEANENLL